jgi:hypothetical protein
MQTTNKDSNQKNIDDFIGLTLGVWKGDLFAFGGIPRSNTTKIITSMLRIDLFLIY